VVGESVEVTGDCVGTGAPTELDATSGDAALEAHAAVTSTTTTRHRATPTDDRDLIALSPPVARYSDACQLVRYRASRHCGTPDRGRRDRTER
jgi:hypothetical protein